MNGKGARGKGSRDEREYKVGEESLVKLEKEEFTHGRGRIPIKEKEKSRIKPGHSRSEMTRELDINWVAEQVAKGRTYRDIAKELGISHVQVYHDVQQALIDWKRERMEYIDAYVAKDLARLDYLEGKVMSEYEASKKLRPSDYAALMRAGMADKESIDDMFRGHELSGDPRFLDTLLRLQMQRMKLLGIDKGNDVAQHNVVNYNFGDMRMDELVKIADNIQDVHLREILTDNQEQE